MDEAVNAFAGWIGDWERVWAFAENAMTTDAWARPSQIAIYRATEPEQYRKGRVVQISPDDSPEDVVDSLRRRMNEVLSEFNTQDALYVRLLLYAPHPEEGNSDVQVNGEGSAPRFTFKRAPPPPRVAPTPPPVDPALMHPSLRPPPAADPSSPQSMAARSAAFMGTPAEHIPKADFVLPETGIPGIDPTVRILAGICSVMVGEQRFLIMQNAAQQAAHASQIAAAMTTLQETVSSLSEDLKQTRKTHEQVLIDLEKARASVTEARLEGEAKMQGAQLKTVTAAAVQRAAELAALQKQMAELEVLARSNMAAVVNEEDKPKPSRRQSTGDQVMDEIMPELKATLRTVTNKLASAALGDEAATALTGSAPNGGGGTPGGGPVATGLPAGVTSYVSGMSPQVLASILHGLGKDKMQSVIADFIRQNPEVAQQVIEGAATVIDDAPEPPPRGE